jgi:hypothetical protein
MQTLPRDIHLGMKVYDSRHKSIGTVEDFRFSENEENPDIVPGDIDATDRRRPDSIIDNIAEAFRSEDLPEVLRDRLLTEGYIRLDTKGLLARDRYILPDQIASTSGDEVMLNVEKDELIKRH